MTYRVPFTTQLMSQVISDMLTTPSPFTSEPSPRGLWLRQFQNAVVRRGMIFFPLSPIGKPGHIYIFDVASTSPKGNLGATIDGTGVDQYFIGIY